MSFFPSEVGKKIGREREWGGDDDGTYPPARFDRLSATLPKWEGGLSVDGCAAFQVNACFKRSWLLPLGGDGREILSQSLLQSQPVRTLSIR